MTAPRIEACTYTNAPAVLCDVYEHKNGKRYHAVNRYRPDWARVGGPSQDGRFIYAFPINPKTGRGWQASRAFDPADLTLVGTVEV